MDAYLCQTLVFRLARLFQLNLLVLIGTALFLGSLPDAVSAQPSSEALLQEAEEILEAYRAERAKPAFQQSSAAYADIKGRIDAIWTPFMRISGASERGRTLRVEIGTAYDWLRLGPASLEWEKKTHEQEQRREAAIRARQWPSDVAAAVLARKVTIGMTTEQVEMAWGRPTKINETITASEKSEQWVYPGNQLLYFSNGLLRTIQRTRR